MQYNQLKKLLFLLPPEQAHYFAANSLSLAAKIPMVRTQMKKAFQCENSCLEREVMGLRFKNPIGLAAGFDKNATLIDPMALLGFGFLEVGTVTPRPQAGNPKPRLFRLPQDKALINRMGFNNLGVDAMVEQLKQLKEKRLIIGGNIGKNKSTPNEDAVEDYLYCFRALYHWVDYFVVNVSSPNTPNLRALQEKEPLEKLLNALQDENNQQSSPKPILLKIAPDLNDDQLNDIIDIVRSTTIEGVIATNTTISRDHLKTDQSELQEIGAGGLSGQPLEARSTAVIKFLRKALPKCTIIGVGGIHGAHSAMEKLNAGADLIQLYTGLIYEGPHLIKQINQSLLNKQTIT